MSSTGRPGTGAHRLLAEVRESESLPGHHHRLVLKAAPIAADATPGQFVNVWCHSPEEIEHPPCSAILRRPYSISRLRPPAGLELLLRVRGVGGRLLAAKKTGDQLDIIGPLGRGFQLKPELRKVVVVAGGIGLAPIPFLIETLVSKKIRVILLAGAVEDAALPYRVARSGEGVATLPELTVLGAEVSFVSEAVEGRLVTDLLAPLLEQLDPSCDEVMAVGPRAMLKKIAAMAEGRIRAQVSLEERMACGVGACRSCVVPVKSECKQPAGERMPTLQNGPAYKTVCRDGPVFYTDEIDWGRLEP